MTNWRTSNIIGLVLQVLFGVFNLPSGFDPALVGAPTPDKATAGPPMTVMWACTVLSAVVIVAGGVALAKKSRMAARLASAATLLITFTALPAFFVPVPAFVKAVVAATVLWSIVAVALTLAPAKRSAAV